MTVSTTTAKAGPYAGAGTAGPFAVAFRFLEDSHLRVVRTDAEGVDTVLALGADYGVTGAGDSVGAVTLTAPLPVAHRLTILRSVPATQEADYVQNDAFPAESHERALDKLTMLAQETAEKLARAIVLPVSDSAPRGTTLPSEANRAGKALVFDASGNVSVSTDNYNDQQANVSELARLAAEKAGEAAYSAQAAGGSRAAIDNRIYPGSYAVDPATRPDGSPVQEGDEAFNSTEGVRKRYTGGAWKAGDLSSANLGAPSGASLVGYLPAGSISATTVQAAIDELDAKKSRSLFAKADTDSVAFTKTGAGTISLKAGTYVDVAGALLTFAAATAVTMPALSAGTDYAVYACADGTLRADASFTSPTGYTAANSRLIGGFHYGLTAPGTTVAGGSFATAGTGMIWTQADVDAIAGINAFSLWDLKWRCKGEQKSMALDPYAGVWAAIYFCPSNHIANGISKYNTDVASGTVLPRIPVAYGGNGSANYTALTWWAANEIANSHGHRLPTEREFSSAAFGVTENQSLGGASSTIPATARQPGYTSRIGLEQVTGHVWTWGADSSARWDGASTPWNWRDVNGGRGQVYLYGDVNLARVLLGGDRGSAAMSGSRASNWGGSPWSSSWTVGLRAFGDHLKLV